MANLKLTAIVVMTVICSACIQQGATLSCYSCGSDGTGADTNGCGADSNRWPQNSTVIRGFSNLNQPCQLCTTTVNGPGLFERGCVAIGPNQAVGCVTSLTSGGIMNAICYCNQTDNCNNKPIYYGRGSLQCHVCQSVDFMDNGCGATLDTASQYVKQVSGCVACGKSVSYSTGGGAYTRSCLYSVSSGNTCATGTDTCFSRCDDKNLCNTATTTTTTRYPVIVALGFALYGASWL